MKTLNFFFNTKSWNLQDDNLMVLLHGPPGTEKTSLCNTLAQRLTVRLSNRYKRWIFIKVNFHSLFSKWFAESRKLIMKLFEQIEECASDFQQLVFVLIDEVESLTIIRTTFYKGNDPSAALRSVNAVLTQMDKIRRYRNVVVLTTSNITEALDEAFVAPADINRYVGHPSEYLILDSMKLLKLLAFAAQCCGISCRTIHKLPTLAYSRLCLNHLSIDQFLDNLGAVINEKIVPKLATDYTCRDDNTLSSIPDMAL